MKQCARFALWPEKQLVELGAGEIQYEQQFVKLYWSTS